MTIRFLTVPDVEFLHREQLALDGGDAGLVSRPLLESAVAQPQVGFGGEYAHAFPHEMAAAYLFHLVSDHPFCDGNKRVGLHAALVVLDLNGVELRSDSDEVYDLTMPVAAGEADKDEAAAFFRERTEATG